MSRIAFYLIGLVFLQEAILSQPLIGMKKQEIIVYMNQSEPDFVLDNSMVNKQYNYLKYFDRINEETILCFLSDDNICTFIRRMSDYSNLQNTLKRLDKEYKKIENDKWIYSINKEEFMVELKREKWYFTLETKRKK